MAVLNAAQLVEMRNGSEEGITTQTYEKADINAALQAIEDTWESNRASLGSAIDTATSPHAFTNTEKKTIGKYWMKHKFGQGG